MNYLVPAAPVLPGAQPLVGGIHRELGELMAIFDKLAAPWLPAPGKKP